MNSRLLVACLLTVSAVRLFAQERDTLILTPPTHGESYSYNVRAVNQTGEKRRTSEMVAASPAALTDSTFLDLLQRAAFDFFWNEANPSNGLIKDRNTSGSPCSIASVGFGLSAICVAIDRGWISRADGRDRVLTTLKTFWEKPQGRNAQRNIGYKGFFYHFLDMSTALRTWNSELSSIDTALLLAGTLDAK